MAFDFNKGAKKKMARATPKSNPAQTFADAKELCLTTHFDTQITNFQKGDLYDSRGTQKASNWMRKDSDGDWWISYRIKQKPIYFNEVVAEENGWIPSDDVVADLNAIREEVASGKWDAQLKEAFTRMSPKEKRAAEKAALAE